MSHLSDAYEEAISSDYDEDATDLSEFDVGEPCFFTHVRRLLRCDPLNEPFPDLGEEDPLNSGIERFAFEEDDPVIVGQDP